jgi:hypothetical protein
LDLYLKIGTILTELSREKGTPLIVYYFLGFTITVSLVSSFSMTISGRLACFEKSMLGRCGSTGFGLISKTSPSGPD